MTDRPEPELDEFASPADEASPDADPESESGSPDSESPDVVQSTLTESLDSIPAENDTPTEPSPSDSTSPATTETDGKQGPPKADTIEGPNQNETHATESLTAEPETTPGPHAGPQDSPDDEKARGGEFADATLSDLPRACLVGMDELSCSVTNAVRELSWQDVWSSAQFTISEITPAADADPLEKVIAGFVYTVLGVATVLFFGAILLS